MMLRYRYVRTYGDIDMSKRICIYTYIPTHIHIYIYVYVCILLTESVNNIQAVNRR